MIGQVKLLEKLHTYTESTLPHTILLEGDFGSGKHTIVYDIADKLHLEVEDISTDLCKETFDRIQEEVYSKIYIIDSSFLQPSNGSILKFIEEPPINAYIFILCLDKALVLPTIVNRCVTFTLSPYTLQELKQFGSLPVDDYYKIANTPNKVRLWKEQDFNSAISLCNTMLEKVPTTKLSNVLMITDKIKFSDKDIGYDLTFFVNVLRYSSYQSVIKNSNKNAFKEYNVISKLISNLQIPQVDKKRVFENFLCELKDCV